MSINRKANANTVKLNKHDTKRRIPDIIMYLDNISKNNLKAYNGAYKRLSNSTKICKILIF